MSRHIPVMLEEVLSALAPKCGDRILDGTFGAGGYSRALLEAGAEVIALDRDPRAIAGAAALRTQFQDRLNVVEARFGDLADHGENLQGVVLDIGVSSMQLDDAERGFSFRADAPLDMRMESIGPTAADLLRDSQEEEIADILYVYGEERASRRIARAIVADRETTPFISTKQLADLVGRVAPARPGELTHPATKTFQALRIAVNDELGELKRALEGAEKALVAGGRLAIVTFHSLEDRIVKQFLATRSGRGQAASRLLPGEPLRLTPTFSVPTGPVSPGETEIRANPRARSAKLRWADRTAAPARSAADAKISLRGKR